MNLSAFSANWRTTITSILAALTSALTVLAALPAQLGDLSTIIPEQWKPRVIEIGLVATILLRIINGSVAKDATITGNGTLDDPTRKPSPSGNTSVYTSLCLLASGFCLLFTTGCATTAAGRADQRAKFDAWFHSPANQAVLADIGRIAFQEALSFAQDYANNGRISSASQDAMVGGINGLRQIELTPDAGSNEAVAATVTSNTALPVMQREALGSSVMFAVDAAKAAHPEVPASVVLEQVTQSFPTGIAAAAAPKTPSLHFRTSPVPFREESDLPESWQRTLYHGDPQRAIEPFIVLNGTALK